MTEDRHIIVLGAGVTGLTSSIFLSEAGYRVTIIAAHVPGDKSIEYTSPWAGAHWMTHATPEEPVQCDWDVQTYKYLSEIIAQEGTDEKSPRSGLKHNHGYGFYADPPSEGKLWWAPHVKNFREEPVDASPVADINAKAGDSVKPIRHAISYTSISINAPQYLLFLQDKARLQGTVIIKARLPTTSGLDAALRAAEELSTSQGRPPASAFVNATGLGASKLCKDMALYPIRGQTVTVKGEAAVERTRSGPDIIAYCVPRPGSGTSTLGGTRDAGNWSETPDDQITSDILKHNAWQAPELLTAADGGFQVLSVQCGLRPGRKGGPRVEREVVNGKQVVHAYGHAGGGYQNSVGSARLVLKLVKESLEA